MASQVELWSKKETKLLSAFPRSKHLRAALTASESASAGDVRTSKTRTGLRLPNGHDPRSLTPSDEICLPYLANPSPCLAHSTPRNTLARAESISLQYMMPRTSWTYAFFKSLMKQQNPWSNVTKALTSCWCTICKTKTSIRRLTSSVRRRWKTTTSRYCHGRRSQARTKSRTPSPLTCTKAAEVYACDTVKGSVSSISTRASNWAAA